MRVVPRAEYHTAVQVPQMPFRHWLPKTRSLAARSARVAVVTLLAVTASVMDRPVTAQGFAGGAFVPADAVAAVRVAGEGPTSAWTELFLDAIELAGAPIRPSWNSGEQLRSRLAPDCQQSIHAIGPGGRHWLHAIRWTDPIAVEFGLQRLGSRPMGGGRFRLPALGLEIAIAGEWLLIAPNGCPWLDAAVDRATLDALDDPDPVIAGVTGDLPPGPIEVLLRHDAPIGGLSAIGIRPSSDTHASVEFAGRYEASPLPIRTAASIDLEVAGRFDGRVAFAAFESGIGLIDPLMIEHAARHPEIVPGADLRGRFASRRLIVLDGEPVRIEPLGIVEVPAACVAVPMREDRPQTVPNSELATRVDSWLETAGRAVRSSWSSETGGAGRTRGDEIRHLPLSPGLLDASGGHPMAIGASLNWILHPTAEGGTWLVAGTSPGLVRRVTATLDEIDGVPRVEEIAGAGVASPSRIALQIAELAQLRGLGPDAQSAVDADALAAAAAFLQRVERIRWRTTRQDDRAVRASAEIRLVPGPTGTPPR